MEHRQLRTFRAVANNLSFTRAAAELGYVQSAVTAQIKAMERELGVPLFDRLGRQVVLTDAGLSLFPYAERILDLSDEAQRTVCGDGEMSGTLSVGASETLCVYRLPGLLRLFGNRFPHVKLSFKPVPYAELRGLVANGSLDIAFLLEAPMRVKNLVSETLIREPLLLVAPPDHPLAVRSRVLPKDLADEPMLLTDTGCSYRRMFERELAKSGVEPGRVLEFDNAEAIKQCVIAGLGISVLPEVTVAESLARSDLVALTWKGARLEIETQMVSHKDKWISPALGAFLGTAREVLGVAGSLAQSEGRVLLNSPG